ncbi:probable E3 ubiquitin-protein ligase HERC4 isoform X1 [Montipora capricornis]|uniref:probable E3 ubiquitin-protein ligase HERC4 isoform X1 n=1 Tax=Montipora capricornis TaxID=246305 RepID=UPI0035F19DA1
MYCWGKIGVEPYLAPKNVEDCFCPLSEIKEIVCGWEHTAVLKNDGVICTCGNNENGQLGHHKDGKRLGHVVSLETHTIKQVACGQMHTLAVTDNGLVFAWGDNTKGQLGIGNTDNNVQTHPRVVKHLQTNSLMVTQVACGARHSLALTTGGFLFAWGDNKNGQLGIGHSNSVHYVPEHVSSLVGVPFSQISAGGYHSFALTLSGALFSWGRNNFGQLGVNDDKDRIMPVLIKSLRSQRVRHVTAGEYHSAVLTEDGGVFTFGWGSYGQLGHNSYNDEFNPRKVFELMGKVVTQIACGRLHTLAYVASSGRLYSFGSGDNGQLGNNKVAKVNSPGLVHMTWAVGGSKVKTMPCEIHRIASGGDQCYVLTAEKEGKWTACDLRVPDTSKRLWTLTEGKVKDMQGQLSQGKPPTDLFQQLEMIFSSAACLNGSFLDSRNHEQTSSWIHGINLASARKSFEVLNKIAHRAFSTTLFDAIKKGVIHSLQQPPPDIEALRVYLLLPECSVYKKEEHYDTIVIPFSEVILRLSAEAGKVLRRWWSTLPSTYFSNTIKMFQDCVKYLLHFPPPKVRDEAVRRQSALGSCLGVLQQLHVVNTDSGDIVPFNQFYIPEIQETIDIRADYFNWIQNQIVTNLQDLRRHLYNVQTFSFCRYPFVFDAEAKTSLLQTDAIMQMQSAVEEVNRRNLQSMISPMPIDPVNPILMIVVKRESIVEHTLTQIMKCGPYDLKKPLKVVFLGEEGVDAGGVRKEFFLLLLTEILDPKYGMFTYVEESHTIWFNDLTFEENPMFLLIGVICGLAIYNSTIIDLRFPPVLYKKLLGRKPTLDDFRGFKPAVAKNLQYLLDYPEDDDIVEVFGLNFQIIRDKYGELDYVDLIPDGGNTSVNSDNRQEYVDVYIDYYLNKSVEKQFQAFSTGFHRVCGGKVLEFFHPEELMQMVVGCQDYDFRELEKVAEYKGEYYRHHPVIENFWEVFLEFPINMKKKFLAFLTGSDRVPILGMKSMKIIIQPVAGGKLGDHLPVAHTCFNLLDLPRYPTKKMLKNKLSQAVEYSTGFGLA